MTTREQIIAAARESDPGFGSHTLGGSVVGFDAVERFYTIAFEAGRVAEREECAKVCDEKWKRETNFDAYFCGKAIRARGDTK